MKKAFLVFLAAAAVLTLIPCCVSAEQNAAACETVKKDAAGNAVELRTKDGLHIAYMGTFRLADETEKPTNDVVSVFMVRADRDMTLWTDTGGGVDTKTNKFNYRDSNWCHIAGNNTRQVDILEDIWMRVEFFHVLPLDKFGELPRVGRFNEFAFAEAGHPATKLVYRKIRLQPASALKALEPALVAIEDNDSDEIEIPTASKPRTKENGNKPKPDTAKSDSATPDAAKSEGGKTGEKSAPQSAAGKIWLGPVQVTGDNREDLAKALGLDKGTITCTPASGGKPAQLNLSGVTIENLFTDRYDTSPSPASYHWWSYAAVYSEEDLIINVSGLNLIDTSGFSVKGANLHGIFSRGNLTIQGDGSFIVHNGNVTNNNSVDYRDSIAVYAAGTLTVKDSVSLLAEGGRSERNSAGLRGNRGIRIDGSAEVIASGGLALCSFGCWEGPVEVHGGTLSMFGEMRALEGTLLLKDGFTAVTNTETPNAEDNKEKTAGSLMPGTYSEEARTFRYIKVSAMPASVPQPSGKPEPQPAPQKAPVPKPAAKPAPRTAPEPEKPAASQKTLTRENFADSLWTAVSQESLKTALSSGADINAANSWGNTALLVAVVRREPDIAFINALIKSGADLNMGDGFGCTALIRSVRRSDPRPEVIAALLDAGADTAVKDQWGHTAADYAQRNGKLKGTDVLKRLEAANKQP
ncbi:MAG: hypothetical protein K6E38_02810 [Fretibacterium sp.]|nr:hypothetical protein [Fretibacterium sp.]